MEIVKPFSAITADTIQNWKARCGADNLREITIDNFKFILRTPSRTVIDLVAQHGNDKKVIEANKVLISNCVLGGDIDEMENDGSIYTELLSEIRNLLTKRKATVKKL